MDGTRELPLIHVEGPARERGRQYGKKAQDRIEGSLRVYRNLFAKRGFQWNDALQIARGFMDELEHQYSDLVEEVRGIAEGSGSRLEEIVVLNARYEIANRYRFSALQSGPLLPDPKRGCTGAIVFPGASANGHVLHGQTWDYLDECADTVVVLSMTDENGRRILTQTEAGSLARCGINDDGVALTANFLKCDSDHGELSGAPSPFIRRRMLQAGSASEAADVLSSAQRPHSFNIMVSDRNGNGKSLEATRSAVWGIDADQGVLVHANHFVSKDALCKIRDIGVTEQPDSRHRHDTVHKRLTREVGNIDIDVLKAAFADRTGSPYSVCASPIARFNDELESTVVVVLMDVTAQCMWVAPRPYSPHYFTKYAFD